jgi:hypothetical protein
MQRHIGKIVDKATDLVVNFLDGVSRNLPRVVDAGINLVIAAVNGVADGIRRDSSRMGEAGANLATALIEGTIRGIGAGIGRAVASAANMAKEMLNAAKGALGIQSPSKEFAWVMEMSIAGLTTTADKQGYKASDAAADIGYNMIDAMSKSLTGLSKVLGSDLIDFDPTITPVLDLSLVKKDAAEMLKMLDIPSLNLSSTSANAQSAKESVVSSKADPNDQNPGSSGTTYNFTQNNTSPKALPPAEIYRNTNNIISRATKKEV